MIGLLIQDNAYEQDIRELLMSFYPGETYAHEVKENIDFYVQTRLKDGEAVIGIWEKLEKGEESAGAAVNAAGVEAKDSAVAVEKQTDSNMSAPEGLEGWTLTAHFAGKADLSDHSATKNVIKKLFYQMLVGRTGHELPWGSLTGIRPTKIALSRLEDGWKEDDIRRFMKETYMTSDEKINLSVEIAAREKRLMEPINYDSGYSLYVGIPFCPTTCLYCSFTSYPIGKWKDRTHEYLDALFKELDYVAEKKKGCTLDTVYFGGGTPTSLSPEDLDRLITKLKGTFDFSAVQEFTVEAGRPDSITREKLEVLKKHGVGRISINPQTMKQDTLRLIGRRHTVEDVVDRFKLAREVGFDNINMDLIIGLPEETLEDVQATMEAVKALAPDSVTVHSLAIKRAARLNTMKEVYKDLKIENTQEMIDLTARYAREMGLEPYYLYRQKNMAGNFENVGYAAPGKACIYNVLIMEEQQTIIGCGAGTTTKRLFAEENRIERCENVKDVEQYISRVEEMIERKEKLLSDAQ